MQAAKNTFQGRWLSPWYDISEKQEHNCSELLEIQLKRQVIAMRGAG